MREANAAAPGGGLVRLGRRILIGGAVALLGAAGSGRADERPIVFVHGNGDSAALWMTTIWRFESNGYDPSRLVAIDLPHPSAPVDDGVPEPNRSTTTDQVAALAGAVARVLLETDQDRVVLVGSSRGGNTIRNYIARAGGHATVSLAILCGTPNHGVFDAPDRRGSEWNRRGFFLSRLNRERETHPAVAWVTLRSDRNDKYAQPSTGVGYDSPALDGARNLVLPGLDHREVAFHERAFREMYRVIVGRDPDTVRPVAEARPVLDGVVSGWENGAPTNLPLAGALVEVYEVDPQSGLRRGAPRHRRRTGPDGRWGPFAASPDAFYELVVTAEGYPVTHVYRSPFPRSSRYVHLRLEPLEPALADRAGVVVLTRPRGYFGIGRDVIAIDGELPPGIAPGVPQTSRAVRVFPFPPSRSVRLVFNDETLTVRTAPAGHVVIGEMHY